MIRRRKTDGAIRLDVMRAGKRDVYRYIVPFDGNSANFISKQSSRRHALVLLARLGEATKAFAPPGRLSSSCINHRLLPV